MKRLTLLTQLLFTALLLSCSDDPSPKKAIDSDTLFLPTKIVIQEQDIKYTFDITYDDENQISTLDTYINYFGNEAETFHESATTFAESGLTTVATETILNNNSTVTRRLTLNSDSTLSSFMIGSVSYEIIRDQQRVTKVNVSESGTPVGSQAMKYQDGLLTNIEVDGSVSGYDRNILTIPNTDNFFLTLDPKTLLMMVDKIDIAYCVANKSISRIDYESLNGLVNFNHFYDLNNDGTVQRVRRIETLTNKNYDMVFTWKMVVIQ